MKKQFLKSALAVSLGASMLLCPLTAFAADTAVADKDAIHLSVNKTKLRLDFISDVVYSQIYTQGQSVPLKMDMIIPRMDEKVPVVVFVKGGGFSRLNKDQFLQQRMQLAEAGYAVITVEHRLVPTYTFPSSIIDVKSSIRYLRTHADEYGLDGSKVAIWGDSSGGYASAMVGTSNGVKEFDQGENLDQSSDVQLCIDWYGPTDLTTIGKGLGKEVEDSHKSASTTEAMLVNGIAFGTNPGGSVYSDLVKAEKANPLTYVDPSDPPFLLFHGTADPLVSPYETKILYEKLKENKVNATLYLVDGAGHADDYFFQDDCINLMIDFLNKHFK